MCSTTELPQHVERDLDSLVVGRKSKNVPNLHNIARPYRKSVPVLDPDQSFGSANKMAGKQKKSAKLVQSAREARLKAALKANMGRRKAQARARASGNERADKKDS